jgi:hypothetical protein
MSGAWHFPEGWQPRQRRNPLRHRVMAFATQLFFMGGAAGAIYLAYDYGRKDGVASQRPSFDQMAAVIVGQNAAENDAMNQIQAFSNDLDSFVKLSKSLQSCLSSTFAGKLAIAFYSDPKVIEMRERIIPARAGPFAIDTNVYYLADVTVTMKGSKGKPRQFTTLTLVYGAWGLQVLPLRPTDWDGGNRLTDEQAMKLPLAARACANAYFLSIKPAAMP